jgi:hypothetical protein
MALEVELTPPTGLSSDLIAHGRATGAHRPFGAWISLGRVAGRLAIAGRSLIGSASVL